MRVMAFNGYIYYFSFEKAEIGSKCLNFVKGECVCIFENTNQDSMCFVIKATDNENL